MRGKINYCNRTNLQAKESKKTTEQNKGTDTRKTDTRGTAKRPPIDSAGYVQVSLSREEVTFVNEEQAHYNHIGGAVAHSAGLRSIPRVYDHVMVKGSLKKGQNDMNSTAVIYSNQIIDQPGNHYDVSVVAPESNRYLVIGEVYDRLRE